ncbi:MAG: LAGLIDADG family homing endonuclease [bacterium]|nr:LAGLIDADG family homing endonuclease [bacterium]
MGIKYKFNENFFKKWNPQMAYILGYLYADGNLTDARYMRGQYTSVTSIDLVTIRRIKSLINSEHTIVPMKATTPHGSIRYLLRIGSHKLYADLQKLGLYPNKSLTIKFPKVPRRFLNHFVRGYFDGDGCVYLWRSKGLTQKIIVRKLMTIFTSGSRKFLEGLLRALREKLSLRQNRIYNGNRCFDLRFATKDSVEVFKFLYKNTTSSLYLKRKYKRFLEYFILRPTRVDKSIRSIIRYVNHGHVVK